MNIQFHTYNIPFTGSFNTAQTNFYKRKGVIIQMEKDGITALGEASPLPVFSDETINGLTTEIQQNRSSLTKFFGSEFTLNNFSKYLQKNKLSASLEFGLFTVAVSYLSHANHLPIHEFLFDGSSKKVEINAVIDLNKRSGLQRTRQYVKQGFQTIKLKTGVDWQQTYHQIQKIRDEFETLHIRLDVNQGWRADDAAEYLKQVEELEIEYCEEPIRKVTAQKLENLKKETSISIALDETTADWPDTKELASIADVLVIKPMVIGNYDKIKNICDFAKKNDKKVVFTGSLGTGIERLMTATLAAGLGSKNLAHGLNTGRLLSEDVWSDENFIQNGYYKLPGLERLKATLTAFQTLSGLKEI